MLGEDALGVEGDYEFFLSLLDILSVSAYLKEIGRELLESRYKDLALRDQEIKQREEQEKKEGKEQAGAEKRERKAKKVQEKAERKIAKLDAAPVADVIADRD
jgi:hypothetical protein